MPVVGTAVERLRAATAAVHHELDGALSITDRLAAPAGPAAMAPRYYALHAIAERAILPPLAALPPSAHTALNPGARQRAPAIAAALHQLGLPVPAPTATLPIASLPAALGGLYVLEGSSLGGRLILRALRARGVDTSGLAFLDPYGEQTGAHWRALLAVLEQELAAEAARAEACEAALATFALARTCLHQGAAALPHAA
jgi:heme oxygenase